MSESRHRGIILVPDVSDNDEVTYSESDDDHEHNEDWPSSPRASEDSLDFFADVSDNDGEDNVPNSESDDEQSSCLCCDDADDKLQVQRSTTVTRTQS
jgi:hypothetical protein